VLSIASEAAVRRLCTTDELHDHGYTRSAIRSGCRQGRWTKVIDGIYGSGAEPVSALDIARAVVLATNGVASGTLAAVLHELDGVVLRGPDFTVPWGASAHRRGARRRRLADERIVKKAGIRCVDGLQTMLDLAPAVDDLLWEQALEAALRKGLTTIDDLERASRSRGRGVGRMRRVLALRPTGALPTESLLETLAVQLLRLVPGAPVPVRQHVVRNEYDEFVARVDLCWPELGLFIELDGEHHRAQPVYDASRETAIVAATGWLCGRFTWTEIVRYPEVTAHRLAQLIDQARRRTVTR
jgi:hypothetical protein